MYRLKLSTSDIHFRYANETIRITRTILLVINMIEKIIKNKMFNDTHFKVKIWHGIFGDPSVMVASSSRNASHQLVFFQFWSSKNDKVIKEIGKQNLGYKHAILSNLQNFLSN